MHWCASDDFVDATACEVCARARLRREMAAAHGSCARRPPPGGTDASWRPLQRVTPVEGSLFAEEFFKCHDQAPQGNPCARRKRTGARGGPHLMTESLDLFWDRDSVYSSLARRPYRAGTVMSANGSYNSQH